MDKGVAQKPLAPARVYALVQGELKGGSEVVIGTAPILGFEASVLLDSRATHSFVSIIFVRLSRHVVRTLEPGLAVTTSIGKTMVCKHIVYECPVDICRRVLLANLFSLCLVTMIYKFNCTRNSTSRLQKSVHESARSIHKELCFVENQFSYLN